MGLRLPDNWESFTEFPQQALFLLQKKADLRANRHPMDARKQV